MFLIRLFRFLTGYIVFSGNGGFPERFINLCSLNGISLWDTKCSAGKLTSKTTISGYRSIRTCAKKSGIKLRIEKKCGLPFIARPYIQRKGLFIGSMISLVLICILSSCIWTIEVTGNEKFTDEQIIEIAENYGIHIGAFHKNLDIKEIRTRIKTETEGINWFSANTDNSHAILQVSESSGTTQIIDTTEPCNIISDVSGEVLKIETKSGAPVPLIGSAVTEGDLLISGVCEKSDGTPYFVHARGRAVIRTDKKSEITLPTTISIKKITELDCRYYAYLFGVKIPLNITPEGTKIRTSESMLCYKGKKLPAGIITDYHIKDDTTQITLNQQQLQPLASYFLFKKESDFMKNAVPESKKITIKSNKDKVQISAHHIIHKESGIENYFEVID